MEISTKNLLGLAMKAGKIISGEEACMRGFKKKDLSSYCSKRCFLKYYKYF